MSRNSVSIEDEAPPRGEGLMRSMTSIFEVGAEHGDGKGHSFAQLPGIGVEALIDDDAAVVLVFPIISDTEPGNIGKSESELDPADAKASLLKTTRPVKDAISEAKKIFLYEGPFLRSWRARGEGAAQPADYDKVVKQALEEVVVLTAGFTVSKFLSIDGDMEFWKVDASTERLQEIAQEIGYMMPHSSAAYDAVGMGKPMDGVMDIPAYGRYEAARAEDFEEFTSADAVRLVVKELTRFVNIDALLAQEVLARWFPAAKFAETKALTDRVVGYPFSTTRLGFPQDVDADYICDYHGEEVAVFFNLFSTMINSLRWPVPLAVLILGLDHFRPWNTTIADIRSLLAIFACVVVIWGMWFATYSKHEFAMAHMRWGAGGQDCIEEKNPGYDPTKRGDWRQGVKSAFGQLVTAVFLVVVVASAAVLGLQVTDAHLASILQTIVTFTYSAVWGRLARWIVQLENRRTQGDFNSTLTMRLAFVKLFVFLVPLLRLAFLTPIVDKVCAHGMDVHASAKQVAGRFYHDSRYPNNLHELNITKDDPLLVAWVEDQHMMTLETLIDRVAHFRLSIPHDEVCFRGCPPVQCELVSGDLWCHTQCGQALRSSLRTLYVSHTLCTLLFIVWSMLQVRWAAKAEMEKGRGSYSLLQYQEKCHIIAPYQYQSQGGCYVEDLLEVVLGFAVLICFSMVAPSMAIIGFVAQTFEYRLLVYRMTWITCRPFPTGCNGFQEVLTIFEVIVYLAIGVNALLVIIVERTYLDYLTPWNELAAIFCAVGSLIMIKVIMRVVLHEKPRDLVEAHDHNEDFIERLQLLRSRERLASDAAPGLRRTLTW